MTLEELLELLGLDAEAGDKITEFADAQAAGLKRTNAELKREKRGLQTRLDNFSDLNIAEIAEALETDEDELDLDELPSLIEGVKGTKEGEKDDPRVAELERKLDKANKRADAAEAAKTESTERLRKQLGEKDLSTVAATEISAASGKVKALMPHVKGRVKTEVDDDGEITHTVLAPNGEPMEDSSGNPATIKMLVDEMRRDDDLAGSFDSPIKDGGMGSKRPGATTGSRKKWSEMNLDERAELKRNNPALAARLKAAA